VLHLGGGHPRPPVTIPDLITTAAAADAGIGVLHYGADYDASRTCSRSRAAGSLLGVRWAGSFCKNSKVPVFPHTSTSSKSSFAARKHTPADSSGRERK